MSKALDKLQTVFSKLFEAEKKMKGKDPCWKGYEMIGMKKKNGKDVPNCVPKNEEVEIAEAKVGDTVSFHHEMKAAPGQKVKKSGTVEKVDGDVVHVKVKDKYGVKRHQVKMSDLVKEEIELEEAISVEHDRYMRSHGKKASGTGDWMFTHRRAGDVDYKNDKEVHRARGSFTDAAKSAKAWAKSHGHSSVYVMEEVELEEASDSKRPPNFTMHPIDRQDYKILKDPKKKPLPKDSKEWGRDGSEKKIKEETELDEEQDSKHFEIYDTKTSKAVHSFKANHMSHANIKADDWLESNRKTGKGLKVRPAKQSVAEEVALNKSKKIPASNKPVDPKDLVVSLSDVPVKKPRGHKQYDPSKEFPGVKALRREEVELDQLFTEAMKVKKKSEETSSKKSIKKGEPLSGKQEPVKMHPEVQTKN